MTLAVLPRHKETKPSAATVRRKQSAIPPNGRSRRPDLSISSCDDVIVISVKGHQWINLFSANLILDQ